MSCGSSRAGWCLATSNEAILANMLTSMKAMGRKIKSLVYCTNWPLGYFLLTLLIRGLRVLLVKQPDISEPTFLTQYQIIYNMKSTYRINVPGTKI